ncbi:MAG: flagellar biosynthesis protein FliQ [Anaerolineae bacterium]|nr:flagellar biosynthesis protein FliQ [Anaerolineae bacterium]
MAMGVLREAVVTTLLLALPLLAVGLVVGLAVSLFQAVTQIHEMTLTFVPKLLGIAAVLVLAGPWMMHRLLAFTRWLFDLLPQMAR